MRRIVKISLGAAVCIGVFLISLPTLVHKAGLHPEYSGPTADLPGKRALIITTSHGVLARVGETEGDPTGVAASEMTHPYYTFLDGGMDVDLASIKGGEIPIDPMTINRVVKTAEDERFLNDSIAMSKAKYSIPIADVDITAYDIVFISGGWGASYDLAQSPVLGEMDPSNFTPTKRKYCPFAVKCTLSHPTSNLIHLHSPSVNLSPNIPKHKLRLVLSTAKSFCTPFVQVFQTSVFFCLIIAFTNLRASFVFIL